MKNITLVCAAGMSTSLLVNKMKEAAKKLSYEAEIQAISKDKLPEVIGQTDVLLLGPQIGYMEHEFKSKYADQNIPIFVINTVDYGMMNGEKVLQQAISAL